MPSLENARKPIRSDGRTRRKTVTDSRMVQRTHVQVARGDFGFRTDGQPENIMPPAPRGGGIKIPCPNSLYRIIGQRHVA